MTARPAFNEQLAGIETDLFRILLDKHVGSIRVIIFERYADAVSDLPETDRRDLLSGRARRFKESQYNNLAAIIEKAPHLASCVVIRAFGEQLRNFESRLFETLLRVAPQAITTVDFNWYITQAQQLRDHNANPFDDSAERHKTRQYENIRRIRALRPDLGSQSTPAPAAAHE